MCGIYGAVSVALEPISDPAGGERMARSLRHRGPDAHSIASFEGVVLGNERLRINDLHPRADQPFADPRERVFLVCNGEIYNFQELRKRYPDYPYRSHSDVETIVPLYLDRGLRALEDLDGMFGLAIWDKRSSTLILARDRAGEKPLFYARVGNEIWFASEIQALLENPAIPREIDDYAVADYLALGYVTEPRTLFRAIRRVESGTALCFTAAATNVYRYWNPAAFTPQPISDRAARNRLTTLLEDAVDKQMIADVPVGIFVSGGVDSSILAALAGRRRDSQKIHTYCARFTTASYDESNVAEEVARIIGTDHTNVPADEQSLLEALEEISNRVAEPIADPAILPTFLLTRAARKDVTVVLSGEGADELFGGYPTYLGHAFAPRFNRMPRVMRWMLRNGVLALPSSTQKVPLEFLLKSFVTASQKPWIERHLLWFGTRLQRLEPEGYDSLMDVAELESSAPGDSLRAAMLLDYSSYLRDNLLVKIDRAAMLNSLEGRAPFLDRHVTSFALSLPTRLRLRRTETKWLLKKVAEQWLPKKIVYRRKRGLSVPVATMMQRELREETQRLATSERLAAFGLDRGETARLVREHLSGAKNHSRSLWPLLMLERWFEKWGAAATTPSLLEEELV